MQASSYGLKSWYSLQSYLGYETNPQQSAITSSESANNSATNGSGYGGLTGDDGVNPFQAAMNRDAGDTMDNNVASKTTSGNDWDSNDWETTPKKSNDGWNDEDWGSPTKEAKQVSPKATKQVSPRSAPKKTESKKMTKQDSWGNDADEWENWLNDDSTSYKPKASPRAAKKD